MTLSHLQKASVVSMCGAAAADATNTAHLRLIFCSGVVVVMLMIVAVFFVCFVWLLFCVVVVFCVVVDLFLTC